MNTEGALSLYRMGYIQVVIATGMHGYIRRLQPVAYTLPSFRYTCPRNKRTY